MICQRYELQRLSLIELPGAAGLPLRICVGRQVWRYTSADRDIEYPAASGVMWTAIPISDNGFTQGAQQEPFVVTLPRSLELCSYSKARRRARRSP
jgi:hypothetical protein